MRFKLGLDPEFMLTKNGQYFSAISVVPSTKHEPCKIGKNSFYHDNVMAECTVVPGNNKEEIINNISCCLVEYANLVKPYKLTIQASQDYPWDQLNNPEAKKVGCTPEYDVYSLSVVKPPEEEFIANPLRTAGGHIHIGCKLAQDEYKGYFIIRMLDLCLGLPSIYIDNDPTSKARRKIYGNAGRFRAPKWGVEYRSLGNFWLASPVLAGLTYDVCNFVLDYVKKEKYYDLWTVNKDELYDPNSWLIEDWTPACCYHCTGYNLNDLRASIDNSDREKGQQFWPLLEKIMPKKLVSELKNTYPIYDLYKEWNIN
jgi:hypothetical protein